MIHVKLSIDPDQSNQNFMMIESHSPVPRSNDTHFFRSHGCCRAPNPIQCCLAEKCRSTSSRRSKSTWPKVQRVSRGGTDKSFVDTAGWSTSTGSGRRRLQENFALVTQIFCMQIFLHCWTKQHTSPTQSPKYAVPISKSYLDYICHGLLWMGELGYRRPQQNTSRALEKGKRLSCVKGYYCTCIS